MTMPPKAYLATGFNAETGAFWRTAFELDQAGAEHAASSWLETAPIGSLADVLRFGEDHAHACQVVSSARRVSGGIQWL